MKLTLFMPQASFLKAISQLSWNKVMGAIICVLHLSAVRMTLLEVAKVIISVSVMQLLKIRISWFLIPIIIQRIH